MSTTLYFLSQPIIWPSHLPTFLQLVQVCTEIIDRLSMLPCRRRIFSVFGTRTSALAQWIPSCQSLGLGPVLMTSRTHTRTHRTMLLVIKAKVCCPLLWASIAIAQMGYLGLKDLPFTFYLLIPTLMYCIVQCSKLCLQPNPLRLTLFIINYFLTLAQDKMSVFLIVPSVGKEVIKTRTLVDTTLFLPWKLRHLRSQNLLQFLNRKTY